MLSDRLDHGPRVFHAEDLNHAPIVGDFLLDTRNTRKLARCYEQIGTQCRHTPKRTIDAVENSRVLIPIIDGVVIVGENANTRDDVRRSHGCAANPSGVSFSASTTGRVCAASFSTPAPPQ